MKTTSKLSAIESNRKALLRKSKKRMLEADENGTLNDFLKASTEYTNLQLLLIDCKRHFSINPLFELGNASILNWLETLSNGVKKVEPSEVFRDWKPLEKGNDKLANNILSFNLLPVSTCGQYCKGCYDLRAMRYTSARAKRYVNTSLAQHDIPRLEAAIKKQIENSRSVQFVRIHVGGDFFNIEYVKMWQRIAAHVANVKPDVKLYTYTKTLFTGMLKEAGINVVKSVYNGAFNYGSFEYVNDLRKQHKGIICPVTVMQRNGKEVPPKFCGSGCTACMSKESVFFVQH